MKNKKETRQYIESIFKNKDKGELNSKSENIKTKLLDYISINNFKNICIYEEINNEVETSNILKKLENLGVKIFTPQMISETEMILIDENYEHYEKEIDVFVIPGRAFTQKGERLGRGRGYYDRLLSHKLYKKSRKIGICFEFQILESIPTEKHDILMNKIITND